MKFEPGDLVKMTSVWCRQYGGSRHAAWFGTPSNAVFITVAVLQVYVVLLYKGMLYSVSRSCIVKVSDDV